MHDVLSDLRYDARVLARRPGFTFVAVLALALGIGASTAIFSVVNTVLLQPLPYDDPGRLMAVLESSVPRFPVFAVSPGAFLEWRAQSSAFERLAAVDTTAFNLIRGDEPERLTGARVSEGVFDMLGVPPVLGRGFTTAESV